MGQVNSQQSEGRQLEGMGAPEQCPASHHLQDPQGACAHTLACLLL